MRKLSDPHITRFHLPGCAWSERLFAWFVLAIFGIFTPLSLWNLLHFQNPVPSCLWLGFVIWVIWDGFESEGSFRRFLIEHLGRVAGREFIGCCHGELLHGFTCFGRRFVQGKLPLDQIESVEWFPGQATSMAGRDMKDWSIALCFRRDVEAGKVEWRPSRDIRMVGPARRREETEILGLAFVDFLRGSGVPMSPDDKGTRFVATGRTGEKEADEPPGTF